MFSIQGHTVFGGEQLGWMSVNMLTHRWRAAEAEKVGSKPSRKRLTSGGGGGRADHEDVWKHLAQNCPSMAMSCWVLKRMDPTFSGFVYQVK